MDHIGKISRSSSTGSLRPPTPSDSEKLLPTTALDIPSSTPKNAAGAVELTMIPRSSSVDSNIGSSVIDVRARGGENDRKALLDDPDDPSGRYGSLGQTNEMQSQAESLRRQKVFLIAKELHKVMKEIPGEIRGSDVRPKVANIVGAYVSDDVSVDSSLLFGSSIPQHEAPPSPRGSDYDDGIIPWHYHLCPWNPLLVEPLLNALPYVVGAAIIGALVAFTRE